MFVGVKHVADRAVRLVARIQRLWQVVGAADRAGRPNPREVAELEARVDRLHALGDRFAHVRLSDHVADCQATGFPGRSGGVCVATEV